ncbi:hypothetical protein AMATHDRAFT_8540 [Amanita thiersii Skay4041]|uniref:DUF6535 domain-containing protein n=1 Tax=Amanita thiersii Skay4041 TaxID=703135 RepID=A0A2A9N7A4_9AGAR|nr:hypothetical protein AMATHDRAFT_8540 [Amanita thiersii Skay4041]
MTRNCSPSSTLHHCIPVTPEYALDSPTSYFTNDRCPFTCCKSKNDISSTSSHDATTHEENTGDHLPPELQNGGKLWKCGDPLRHPLPKKSADPLGGIFELMKMYDKNMCDAWKDEIEKLLIFDVKAGLFSATVTAFTVESYRWLQEDYTETTANLLAQIVLQSQTNSSGIALVQGYTPRVSFTPGARSIRINTFWFSSLILCLSTVVLGILCTQWLREYTRDIPLPPEHLIPTRQMHWEGLLAWKVPDVISTLPVILQLSVLLFFAGVLDLLWSLDHMIATILSIALGLLLLFLILTTVAPVFQYFYESELPSLYQCPYKSPQSFLFFQLAVIIFRSSLSFIVTCAEKCFHASFTSSTSWIQKHLQQVRQLQVTCWLELDSVLREHRGQHAINQEGVDITDIEGLEKGLAWTLRKFSPKRNSDVVQDVFHALHSALPQEISRRIMSTLVGSGSSSLPQPSLDNCGDVAVQYDTMLLKLLTLYSSREKCYDLLDELRVRCINSTKTSNPQLNSNFWHLRSMRSVDVIMAQSKNKPTSMLGLNTKLEVVMQEFMSMISMASELRDAHPDRNPEWPFVTSFVHSLIHTASYAPIDPSNAWIHQEIQRFTSFLLAYFEERAMRLIEAGNTDGIIQLQIAFRRFLRPIHRLERIKGWEEKVSEVSGESRSYIVTSGIVSFMARVLVERVRQRGALVLDGLEGPLRQHGYWPVEEIQEVSRNYVY